MRTPSPSPRAQLILRAEPCARARLLTTNQDTDNTDKRMRSAVPIGRRPATAHAYAHPRACQPPSSVIPSSSLPPPPPPPPPPRHHRPRAATGYRVARRGSGTAHAWRLPAVGLEAARGRSGSPESGRHAVNSALLHGPRDIARNDRNTAPGLLIAASLTPKTSVCARPKKYQKNCFKALQHLIMLLRAVIISNTQKPFP